MNGGVRHSRAIGSSATAGTASPLHPLRDIVEMDEKRSMPARTRGSSGPSQPTCTQAAAGDQTGEAWVITAFFTTPAPNASRAASLMTL